MGYHLPGALESGFLSQEDHYIRKLPTKKSLQRHKQPSLVLCCLRRASVCRKCLACPRSCFHSTSTKLLSHSFLRVLSSLESPELQLLHSCSGEIYIYLRLCSCFCAVPPCSTVNVAMRSMKLAYEQQRYQGHRQEEPVAAALESSKGSIFII